MNNSSNVDINPIVSSAVNKWNSIITGTKATDSTIDNIHITINIAPLSSGILGSAGVNDYDLYYNVSEFLGYHNSSPQFPIIIPRSGYVTLNESNIESLVNDMRGSNSALYYTLLHELGHTLGIGPLWPYLNHVRTKYTEDGVNKYYYTGTHAFREYKKYFPDISNTLLGIPLEDDGGAGTHHAHPEEGNEPNTINTEREIGNATHPGLDNELMTGWLERSDIPMPLSRISIGFLEDLGFTVDYSNADYFSPSL